MGENTQYGYFYKPSYGAKGEVEKGKFDAKLDTADAEIKANKSARHTRGEDYSNTVICADYDHPDDAVTAIASANKTLIVTEVETCDTNFTVPANVTVRFERGGKWTINTGITVTFNGQIDAGLWQIFSYTGTGTLAGVSKVKTAYPQWFGALADGSNDDTSAIQACITLFNNTYLIAGTYKTTTTITFPQSNIRDLYGAGKQKTIINYHGGTKAINIDGGTTFGTRIYFHITDLTIRGSDSNAGTIGIYLRGNQDDAVMERVVVKGFPSHGIRIAENWTISFNAVNSHTNGGDGWHIEDEDSRTGYTNNISLNNCRAYNNTGWGLYHDKGDSCYFHIEVSNNTAGGIKLDGSRGDLISSGYNETNSNYGIYIDSGYGNIINSYRLATLPTNVCAIYVKGGNLNSIIAVSVSSTNVGTVAVKLENTNINIKGLLVYDVDTGFELVQTSTNYLSASVSGIYFSGVTDKTSNTFNDETKVKINLGNMGSSGFAVSDFGTNSKVKIDDSWDNRTSYQNWIVPQILFPATQVPSSNANTLDDYEEGTFTPTITFGGASAGLTYTHQTGLYTKIGRQVTVTAYILLSAKGTSTGTALIGSLPFTSKDDNGAYSAVSLKFVNITFANAFQGAINKNSTSISLQEITEAGAMTVLDNTDFANDSSIMFSATYFTD